MEKRSFFRDLAEWLCSMVDSWAKLIMGGAIAAILYAYATITHTSMERASVAWIMCAVLAGSFFSWRSKKDQLVQALAEVANLRSELEIERTNKLPVFDGKITRFEMQPPINEPFSDLRDDTGKKIPSGFPYLVLLRIMNRGASSETEDWAFSANRKNGDPCKWTFALNGYRPNDWEGIKCKPLSEIQAISIQRDETHQVFFHVVLDVSKTDIDMESVKIHFKDKNRDKWTCAYSPNPQTA
jgi:hypothetical protein